ncbi:MAG: hypothetical protein NTY90_00640 [Candidatus Micrarchaeota archaeon]|nr:hypothetical protein [Candidatus Micrarchaeota archaeon]
MVLCLVALVVFAVLAVFSARYRPLALEAFECVARRMTLRPCETGLDQRIKAKVLSKILAKSPGTARFINKNFEVISWVFTIIFFVSLAYSLLAVYNLYVFGTCTPESPGACVITALKNATATACPTITP